IIFGDEASSQDPHRGLSEVKRSAQPAQQSGVSINQSFVLTADVSTQLPSLHGEILDRTEAGGRIVRFSVGQGRDKSDGQPAVRELIEHLGRMPLPPYIHETLKDPERYQTVYARISGSAAAPTAGLHFTPHLLEQLRQQGVRVGFVTLHVGLDTFRPVECEKVSDHKMHSEEIA